MRAPQRPRVLALALTLTLHALFIWLANGQWTQDRHLIQQPPKEQVVFLDLTPFPQEELPRAEALPESRESPADQAISPSTEPLNITPAPSRPPARMAAPPPPTAQEWAFAARYTLKNSKAYRYQWGQQVRSMMGTAVEGPDQGVVRFRVEIAPEGTLTKLETLWSTSSTAEQLARQAIMAMPPLPPTPTGKPLIFEKTIAFTPFATDGPPSYRDDCLPDPPAFRNPFAWDGQSQPGRAAPTKKETLDPQAMEECLRQLPQDSVEAEMARDQRAMERWGWSR